MSVARLCLYLIILIAALTAGAYLFAIATSAQTISEQKVRPDRRRAFALSAGALNGRGREGGYVPVRAAGNAEVRSPASKGSRFVSAAVLTRHDSGAPASIPSALAPSVTPVDPALVQPRAANPQTTEPATAEPETSKHEWL